MARRISKVGNRYQFTLGDLEDMGMHILPALEVM